MPPRSPLRTFETVLQLDREPGARLDLRGKNLPQMLRRRHLSLGDLASCKIEKVTFGTRDRDEPPTILEDISFADSTFVDVWFANVDLRAVYFRKCKFTKCDFRYVNVARSSFQDTTLTDCDFYRAHFASAAIFTRATLTRVSLDKAWLDGITGLTREQFERRDPPGDVDDPEGVVADQYAPALVQEGAEGDYEEFLQATRPDRPAQHTVAQALEDAPIEAADVYRALSGLWTAQGQFSDASFAYARGKDLERKYASPRYIRRVNRGRNDRNKRRSEARAAKEHGDASPDQLDLAETRDEPPKPYTFELGRSWLWLSLAGTVARYGESLWRVVAGVVGLTLLPGIAYSLFGGVRDAHTGKAIRGILQCWQFSFEQMTASPAKHWESTANIVDLIGSFQTVLGVTLLGLFGFVLAQKLRNA